MAEEADDYTWLDEDIFSTQIVESIKVLHPVSDTTEFGSANEELELMKDSPHRVLLHYYKFFFTSSITS